MIPRQFIDLKTHQSLCFFLFVWSFGLNGFLVGATCWVCDQGFIAYWDWVSTWDDATCWVWAWAWDDASCWDWGFAACGVQVWARDGVGKRQILWLWFGCPDLEHFCCIPLLDTLLVVLEVFSTSFLLDFLGLPDLFLTRGAFTSVQGVFFHWFSPNVGQMVGWWTA